MAITLKDTLLDLRLTEDDVEEHIREIIKARPPGAERRAAISYVQQLVQRDDADLDTYAGLLQRARAVLDERLQQHTFDIRDTKLGSLFTTASNVDYEAPLLISNSEVIAEGATISPASTHLIVTGDYVSLHGIGKGSAVDDTLECGCIVNGGLSIDADNVLIEGVEFKAQGRGQLQDRTVRGRQSERHLPELPLRRRVVHRHDQPHVPGLHLLPRIQLLGLLHARKLRD